MKKKKKKKKEKKKSTFLKSTCFLSLSAPCTSLFLSLPTDPPFLLLCMSLCLLTVPLAVTSEVQVTRLASSTGATLCCYTVLRGSFRFRYKDKEVYRFHPTFSRGPVRECDFGCCNTVAKQNHYGSFMPIDKRLPDSRKVKQ